MKNNISQKKFKNNNLKIVTLPVDVNLEIKINEEYEEDSYDSYDSYESDDDSDIPVDIPVDINLKIKINEEYKNSCNSYENEFDKEYNKKKNLIKNNNSTINNQKKIPSHILLRMRRYK